MPENSLEFRSQALKQLQGLQRGEVARIFYRIQLLKTDPFPENAKKLSGSIGLFRLRVGHYRILYSFDKHSRVVTILSVMHRKEAYRNL